MPASQLQHAVEDYEADDPLAAYGALVALFTAASAGLLVAAERDRRLPDRLNLYDLALVTMATQRLARSLTKDRVTSVVRAPFTRRNGRGAAGEVEDAPRGHGLGLAVGQLLTCPFCVGEWIALGFVSGLLFAPRATRAAASVLAVTSAADLLQSAYVAVAPRPSGGEG
jgi:Protein of unknown function (DUF1360)